MISIYIIINKLENTTRWNIYNEIEKENIINYIDSLNNIEKKAFIIAMDHLGSSFDVLKSNGFINYLKKFEIQKK